MRFPRRRGTRATEAMRQLEPPEPQLSADGSHSVRKLPVSTDDLRKAWAVSRRVSKDDWLEWYGGLCREFLKASPSPALRACWTVAQRYGTVIAGGLAISKNLSLESADIQAFVMERLPIV